MKTILKKTIRKNKNRGLKKNNNNKHKNTNTRKRVKRTKSKSIYKKELSRKRRIMKGGGCCGENNYYSGGPYNPSNLGDTNTPQTFYKHNKNVIDPPLSEGRGVQNGGGLFPYDITNVGRGMIQGIKNGYYGLKGISPPDNMNPWPEQQPSLENQNNQPKPLPEPIDIEKIHSNAGSQV